MTRPHAAGASMPPGFHPSGGRRIGTSEGGNALELTHKDHETGRKAAITSERCRNGTIRRKTVAPHANTAWDAVA